MHSLLQPAFPKAGTHGSGDWLEMFYDDIRISKKYFQHFHINSKSEPWQPIVHNTPFLCVELRVPDPRVQQSSTSS
jgi:hypothetical protein